MNTRSQRACAMTGFLMPVLYVTGFIILARFQIPPSPTVPSAEIAQRFADNRTGIRAGLVICMFSAGLVLPWSVALSLQLRRGEGYNAPMARTQMLMAPAGSVCVVYPLLFWQTAAFREDRPIELIRTLNDMAWLPWVGVTVYVSVGALAIGLSILSDASAKPVFPRWAAYFNFLIALELTTGSLCVFFKAGEFAWNGILAWNIPVGVNGVWFTVMTILCLRAISAEAATAEPITDTSPEPVPTTT